jgi:hypothetical protein
MPYIFKRVYRCYGGAHIGVQNLVTRAIMFYGGYIERERE